METDDEMHVKQSLLSPTALNKVPSATATRTKHQQKVKNPIMFGELPVVGDWREDKDTNKEEDKVMGCVFSLVQRFKYACQNARCYL